MNLRFVSLLAALCSVVPVAHAAEATLQEPVQVAQATPTRAAAVEGAQAALTPPTVHGTLRGVLAAADKGPDALRQYVQRTRMIYAYRFEDYARPEWQR